MTPFRFLPLAAALLLCATEAAVVQLDDSNHDSVLHGNDVVLVNFYADWCRFSQALKPIFEAASEKFKDVAPGKIVFAGVDADRQTGIASRYHVSKYPTLKLFRNGDVVKKEYRSQRSVEAIAEYVQKQLESGAQTFNNQDELNAHKDSKRRNVIASFAAQSGPAYDNIKKIAGILREECGFHIGTAPAGAPAVAVNYQAPNSDELVLFPGDPANFEPLKQWLTEKCIPLVREITFENAEELTEEGLPFLILFKLPDDKVSEGQFTDAVLRELPDQKSSINCLTADGRKFAHPLHHLGKAEKDLPVIAIDSFRHMYLFPNQADLSVPGKLRQFVLDLHSGKLHREFHHGPDAPSVVVQTDPNGAPETQPPPSVFEKLKPSYNRYSFAEKEEL